MCNPAMALMYASQTGGLKQASRDDIPESAMGNPRGQQMWLDEQKRVQSDLVKRVAFGSALAGSLSPKQAGAATQMGLDMFGRGMFEPKIESAKRADASRRRVARQHDMAYFSSVNPKTVSGLSTGHGKTLLGQ